MSVLPLKSGAPEPGRFPRGSDRVLSTPPAAMPYALRIRDILGAGTGARCHAARWGCCKSRKCCLWLLAFRAVDREDRAWYRLFAFERISLRSPSSSILHPWDTPCRRWTLKGSASGFLGLPKSLMVGVHGNCIDASPHPITAHGEPDRTLAARCIPGNHGVPSGRVIAGPGASRPGKRD